MGNHDGERTLLEGFCMDSF